MALINSLNKTNLDQSSETKYVETSKVEDRKLVKAVENSTLSTKGKPNVYNTTETQLIISGQNSILSRGNNPSRYVDNLPK
jgi:hypothetical protein|tara:strand:+ start:926 stop:1168 length:243 start_codon:yes stop_codon:yes gene_type:complete